MDFLRNDKVVPLHASGKQTVVQYDLFTEGKRSPSECSPL